MSGPWLVLPLVGPIRISTLVAAIAVAGVILWRLRSPILALVTVIAWASVFEIAFQATGALLHVWPISDLIWLTAALGGWVLLSALLGVLPNRWLLVATAAAWVVWIAAGFESNAPLGSGPGHPPTFDIAAEVLNELAKSLLALAYLAGALRLPRAAGRFGITLNSRWVSTSRAMDSLSTSERWRA